MLKNYGSSEEDKLNHHQHPCYGSSAPEHQTDDKEKLDKDKTEECVHGIHKEEAPILSTGQSAGPSDPKEKLDKAATPEQSHKIKKDALPD